MAYAAYTEFAGLPTRRQQPVLPAALAQLAVTVASRDALRVRRALVGCPDTGIVRCVPQPSGDRVRLEIRLPLTCSQEVMHRIIDCVPSGEIGRARFWPGHLSRLGLPTRADAATCVASPVRSEQARPVVVARKTKKGIFR
ncbi:MAG: hypothetical protein P4L96_02335 [Rhodoferax sp.]|nr:hypothetical protein [Rhodoferax sp.]